MDEKREKSTLLFFNEAIEYYDKFTDQESVVDEPVRESRFSNNFLRNSMLNELNNLKDIIENNPDLKIEALSRADKEKFHKFISFYRKCPICGNHNHYYNLKQLFFDESKKNLIKELIRLMNIKHKKFRRYNLNMGVPCCDCFKRMTLEK
ncbi:MAG: hypothetical protein KGD65_04760 [Candidatus Lokiarchaeota archaeon]|nr:hypothetical protein [Candidatus Lokiarchaeota archaeon]